MCGCKNDEVQRAANGQSDPVGTNLLLEIFLGKRVSNSLYTPYSPHAPAHPGSRDGFSKPVPVKRRPPTRPPSRPPTTRRRTTTTTKRTTTTTHRPSDTQNLPEDIGGFAGAAEPVVIDNDAPANCTEMDIQILKQSEWKNNVEDTYAFNGDVASQLPERLGPFSLFSLPSPLSKLVRNGGLGGFQRTNKVFRCVGGGCVQAR